MHRTRRTTLSAGSVAAALAAVTWSLLPAGAAQAAAGQTYSAPLVTAIADLPVAAEKRAGYQRTLFPLWDDADGDGCDTREEVLIGEADDPPTVGSGCTITGGQWFSYYDRVSWTDKSRIDIDHVVPLAEAWDSGAGTWTTATREAYANDLGDYRTLIGVTDSVNQAKGDQDVAEWLPTYDKCRYLRDWVAIKHRWGLSVDSTEKAALGSDVSTYGCTNSTITVTLAR